MTRLPLRIGTHGPALLAALFMLGVSAPVRAADAVTVDEAVERSADVAAPASGGAGCAPSLFLAGDTIMMRPWSQVDDPRFLELVAEMRSADVAILNLETLIHEYNGYAQAHSGAGYMASPPVIASELVWAGVDAVANANNHTFDYGAIGVLENLGNLREAGIVVAGSGEDLQRAQAPRYIEYEGGRLALVSMASSFIPYGIASRSRPDLRGRPGLNPLATWTDPATTIPRAHGELIDRVARAIGYEGTRLAADVLEVAGRRFRLGDAYSNEPTVVMSSVELERNLRSIEIAAESADIVVVSIHAHDQGRWLSKLARMAFDHGADVFFAHGPHEIRGLEISDGRPILYGMGDFVFEFDQVERQPADFYASLGLGDDATIEDLFAAERAAEPKPLDLYPGAYEGFAASVCFRHGAATSVRLLPVDLGFDAAPERRGRPQLAEPDKARAIVEAARRASEPYGTRIDYDADARVGVVLIAP